MHIKQSLFHIIEHELLINSVRPQNITVTKDQTCFFTAKNKWKKCVYALLWNIDENLHYDTIISLKE
jgi:hypothetical protein